MCSGLLSGWFRWCRRLPTFQKLSKQHWWTEVIQDDGESASRGSPIERTQSAQGDFITPGCIRTQARLQCAAQRVATMLRGCHGVWHNQIDCIAGLTQPQSQRFQTGMNYGRIKVDHGSSLLTPCILLSCKVSVTVDAPLEKCYEVWADRINYCQWFPLIQEVRPPNG